MTYTISEFLTAINAAAGVPRVRIALPAGPMPAAPALNPDARYPTNPFPRGLVIIYGHREQVLTPQHAWQLAPWLFELAEAHLLEEAQ